MDRTIYYNDDGVIHNENFEVVYNDEPVYTPKIGDLYGGGIVFYTGSTTLITTLWNIGLGVEFGCQGTTMYADDIDGYVNTERIINTCATTDIAARVAWNYSNDYSDWYLPSKYELSLLIAQRYMLELDLGVYWSSNEQPSNVIKAWCQVLYESSESDIITDKDVIGFVRPIRSL